MTYFSLGKGDIDSPGPRLMMATILSEVAERHGFTPEDLKGRAVNRAVCEARFEAYVKMRQLGRTLPQIGTFMGGRDHTTVLNGIRRHAERCAA